MGGVSLPVLRNAAILVALLMAGALSAALPRGQMLSYDRQPPADATVRLTASAISPGIYAFYDSDNLSPAEYPWLTGGVIVRRWNHISTGPGALDWSPLDSWIQREARVGKRVMLRVSPHDGWWHGENLDGTPDWVYDEGVPKVHLSTGATYPQYWHPAYRRLFGEFIAALGAKYDGDPRVEAVEMGVGLYGEAFPGPDDPEWERSGLTDSVWTAYVQEIIDDYASAFWQTPVIFMEQSYPQGNFMQMGLTTDYAARREINIGFNGLREEDESAWTDRIPFDSPGWHSPFGKWVMSGLRLGRFEAHNGFDDPALVYWAVLNALDSNATYLSFYQVDVTKRQNRGAFEFAQKYLGKTIYDAPGAWVALREATPGKRESKPSNYSFGLSQYDPDNTSIPLWKLGGKEGLFARRTDQASARNHLSFKIDSRYLNQNTSSNIEVTVTYLDVGDDTWELDYDAADDPYKVAGVVTKADTKQWKQETFVLTDAYFGKRQNGGTDFRLSSRQDGDDIFHMIRVTSLPGSQLPASGGPDMPGKE